MARLSHGGPAKQTKVISGLLEVCFLDVCFLVMRVLEVVIRRGRMVDDLALGQGSLVRRLRQLRFHERPLVEPGLPDLRVGDRRLDIESVGERHRSGLGLVCDMVVESALASVMIPVRGEQRVLTRGR
ncbi:MAG: hypothetical protein H0T99_09795 [Geodermatophilaceae bacterium]|nr:hypothetical protein [Geodermatophilaceae bacterium]